MEFPGRPGRTSPKLIKRRGGRIVARVAWTGKLRADKIDRYVDEGRRRSETRSTSREIGSSAITSVTSRRRHVPRCRHPRA